MILAAGLGTRLRPFTESHPKALFPVDGKPLLLHALEHVRTAGISEVIVNVHHFAGQIIDYLRENRNFGMEIEISDETGQLLETGGGVKKASWFFEGAGAALVRNADILSDLDLNSLIGQHQATGALATLAVRDRVTSRYFLFDENDRLCGWENRKSGEKVLCCDYTGLKPLAFSGIQVLDPAIFSLIAEEGSFSLTALYLRLAASQNIRGFADNGSLWRDVGTMTAG